MTDRQADGIEDVVRRLQVGADTREHLMDVFVRSTVFLPSSSDPHERFCPILTTVDGIEYVLVGTTLECLPRLDALVHFVARMPGDQLLAGVRPDVGLMVYFGQDAFIIDPRQAAEMRAFYGIGSVADGWSSRREHRGHLKWGQRLATHLAQWRTAVNNDGEPSPDAPRELVVLGGLPLPVTHLYRVDESTGQRVPLDEKGADELTGNRLDGVAEVARRHQAGTDTLEHLMDVFVRSTVCLPSSTDPRERYGPIMTKVDGIEYIVVGSKFETLSRLEGMMHFVATMAGWQVLAALWPDTGVLVHFGGSAFTIEPRLAAEVRACYGIESLAPGSSS